MRLWLVVALMLPVVVSAQSRDEEIRLARSAAPAAISGDAKVWVLDNGHYVVAVPGHSSMACVVIRPTAESVAPECGDAEADATILAAERFRVEQRLAGHSWEECKKLAAAAFASGRLHAPQRPALVYMLSSAQILTDPNGKTVGHWMPHLMVFYPNLHDADFGLVDSPDMDVPSVVEAGTPLSALVVVARNWVDPAPTP
jgi:hypothetical protein